MAVQVIHKCDKCGDEWDKDLPENKEKQIWTVGLGLVHGTVGSITYSNDCKQQWCRKCVEETGFIKAKIDVDAPKTKTYPTFEERAVDFLNELGFTQSE